MTMADATKPGERLHIGDVVQFKATGYVAKVSRFANDGTTDFWADNETGPYKQSDVDRLAKRGEDP
jgi:hypothetical protein